MGRSCTRRAPSRRARTRSSSRTCSRHGRRFARTISAESIPSSPRAAIRASFRRCPTATTPPASSSPGCTDDGRGDNAPTPGLSGLRRAVASPDPAPRPLSLCLLPAPLRARIPMPGLRGAPDDRPHEHVGGPPLPALRPIDAPGGLMAARDLFGGRRVAPSILSSDFSRLGAQVEEVMAAGARVIHVDVMDGHFVPPITIGPLIVESLREQVSGAGGILDVHLMIERPERQIAEFARAGADVITVHQEATPHVHYALKAVREAGCHAGLAITPATPPETVTEVTDMVDLVLCMTVNPGWGGQEFI